MGCYPLLAGIQNDSTHLAMSGRRSWQCLQTTLNDSFSHAWLGQIELFSRVDRVIFVSVVCITLMVISFPLLQRTRCVLGLHFRERERDWHWHMVYCEGHRPIHKVGIGGWEVGEAVKVYYTSALSSTIWWTMYIVLHTFTISHCIAISIRYVTFVQSAG